MESFNVRICEREILEDEYNKLKESYDKMGILMEKKSQLLHTAEKNLQLSEIIKRDISAENESLKLECNRNKLETNKKLDELRKQLQIVNDDKSVVLTYMDKLRAKDEEIESLKITLGNLKSEIKEVNTDEIDKYIKINAELRNKQEILTETFEHLQSEFDKLHRNKDESDTKLQEANITIDNLKVDLNEKKKELTNTKCFLNELQGELQLLKAEKPASVDIRGNSVFAEVDDRRLQVQENMENMKSYYNIMKSKYNELLHKNMQYLEDNKHILKQWKKDMQEMNIEEDRKHDNLRKHIQHFEELINNVESKFKLESDNSNEKQLRLLLEEKTRQNSEMAKYVHRKTLLQFQMIQQIKSANQRAREMNLKLKESELELESYGAQHLLDVQSNKVSK